MQLSNIANLVNLQTDKTIIGYFLSLSFVATYEIGQKLSLFCRMITGLALSALVPAVSELDATGKSVTILKLYEKGNKYLFSITFPILTFIIIFADHLINCWMGTGYSNSVLVARLLVIGICINMLTGVGVMIVRGIGKPSYETKYALVCLTLNVILGLTLVKYYGFVGVVVATPISVILGSMYFILKFHHLYSIPFFRFLKKIYLKPFLVSFFLAIVLYILNLLIESRFFLDTRLELMILLIADSILFFTLFIILLNKTKYWDKEDKNLLITVTGRYPVLGRLIANSIS